MKKTFSIIVLCFGILSSFAQEDASLYLKYADKGDKEFMYKLAECYAKGTGGVSQDYNTAYTWALKSAKKGYAPSQDFVGALLRYGVTMNGQDYKQAFAWTEKASKQDYAPAIADLAEFYLNGIGCTANKYTAQSLYFKAASMNNAYAKYILGNAYLWGDDNLGITADINKGIPFLKESADLGNAKAQATLGFCYKTGSGVTQDYSKSAELFYKSAQQGDPTGLCFMGEAYYYGWGVEENNPNAFYYLTQAVKDESSALPYAYALLGNCYLFGYGVTADQEKGFEYFKKAANGGNYEGMAYLGMAYLYGYGTQQNNSKAVEWLQKSADNSNRIGQYYLGLCYLNGYGVSENYYSAAQYFQKSADQDYAPAQYQMYFVYRDGNGGFSKNYQKAIENLKKAADSNDVDAINSLACEYNSGTYLSKDNAKVLELLKKSADMNSVWAQCVLGESFYEGSAPATSKNYTEAFKYLNMAVNNTSAIPDDMAGTIYRYIGACYRFGRGTSVDQSLASYFTEEAAKYGDKGSQNAIKYIRKKR